MLKGAYNPDLYPSQEIKPLDRRAALVRRRGRGGEAEIGRRDIYTSTVYRIKHHYFIPERRAFLYKLQVNRVGLVAVLVFGRGEQHQPGYRIRCIDDAPVGTGGLPDMKFPDGRAAGKLLQTGDQGGMIFRLSGLASQK